MLNSCILFIHLHLLPYTSYCEKMSFTVVVRIKDTAKAGTNLVFTSVLGYKDRFGIQLATTSYLTVMVGEKVTPLSASVGSFFGMAAILWLIAIVLIIVMALLVIRFIRIKKNKTPAETQKEDLLGFGGMPPTFQPIDPLEMIKR